MSNIKNLTSKIIEEANITAEKLIKEAKDTEKKIIDRKVQEAENEQKIILLKAKSEAEIKTERILSNAQLQVRNLKLFAKGEVLDRIFNEAKQGLNNLTKDEFLKFVKKSILSLDIDGDEEIILGKSYNLITSEFLDDVNKALKSKGKLGTLKISADKRNVSNGYILYKNGVEINCTFDALVKSIRNEIELEIAHSLFT